MKAIIHTQYKENYGAHDWDGEGECPQYWKFKGGSVYTLEGLNPNNLDDAKAQIEDIRKLIESKSDYAEEYIIDWQFADDDETQWEHWETPFEIRKDDTGAYYAFRFVPADDHWNEGYTGKSEGYTMLPNGERGDDYFCDYHKEKKESTLNIRNLI